MSTDAYATPDDDKKSIQQALSDLRDIADLRRSPAWERYFLRRLREKIEPLEKDILENERLTDQERSLKRAMRKVYAEIRDLLGSDEIGFCSIAGIEPGTNIVDGMPEIPQED